MEYGIYTGLYFESTAEYFIPSYNLLSVPLGCSIKYYSPGNIFTLSVTGGALLSYVEYRDTGFDNLTGFELFASAAIGIGIPLTRKLWTGVTGCIKVILFKENIYTGIVPGLDIKLHL